MRDCLPVRCLRARVYAGRASDRDADMCANTRARVRPRAMADDGRRETSRHPAGRRYRALSGLISLLVACVIGNPTLAPAQAVYGSIAGAVADTSGAMLPGATVTVTSSVEASVDRSRETAGSSSETIRGPEAHRAVRSF